MARLPGPIGDALSRTILRRPLHPTQADFSFAAEHVDDAHVLVAVCR
jgi:hypothetical protein